MTVKSKNMFNAAYLAAIMLFNSNIYTKQVHDGLYFNEEAKIIENNVNNSNNLENKVMNFPGMINTNETHQKKLIENVIINNTYSGIDSVIKFVPQDVLTAYLASNNVTQYEKDNEGLNRLYAISKSGDEIAQDRFKLNGGAKRSFSTFTKYLDIKSGDYGTKDETQAFIDLYKGDLSRTAEKYGISPSLLAAVAVHESGGRSFTASNTGALGAFGLTKYLYQQSNFWPDGEVREPINPFNTLEAMDRAADFLSTLITKYKRFDDKNHTLALTAYNQGEPQVDNAIKLARSNGIYKTKEILEFSNVVYPETIDSITGVLNEQFDKDNKNKYLIAQEGREYSGKIRNTMKLTQAYFN